VLKAHNADVRSHRVPIARRDLDENGEITDPKIVADLRALVAALSRRSAVAEAAGA